MEKHLTIVRSLSRLLDTEFGVGKFRFGLDPLIGLIPGIGDAVALAISMYVIFVASQLNLPKDVLVKMITNILIDWGVGTVPVVGDLFDFTWRANKRNLDLLEKYLKNGPPLLLKDNR